MSKQQNLKCILQVSLEQGRKLELALIFELMTHEQVEKLPPENKKKADSFRGFFKREYMEWHGNASTLIRQIAPERYEEFVSYFLLYPRRRALEPIAQQLRNWFIGTASTFHQYEGKKFFNSEAIVAAFFSNQLRILEESLQESEAASSRRDKVMQGRVLTTVA